MTYRGACSKWAAYCKLLGISGVLAASVGIGIANAQQDQSGRTSDRSSEQDQATRRSDDSDESEQASRTGRQSSSSSQSESSSQQSSNQDASRQSEQRRRSDAQSYQAQQERATQDRANQQRSSQNRGQQGSQFSGRSQAGQSGEYGQARGAQDRSGQNQFGQQNRSSQGQSARDQQNRFGQSSERSANIDQRSRETYRDDQYDSQRGRERDGQRAGNQQSDAAWLGVYLRESQTNENGAQVTQVYPAGPAARAGLRAGDVITAVNGQQVSTTEELISAIEEHQPGARTQLTLTRNNQQMQLPITLGSRQSFAWNRGDDWGGQQFGGQSGYASSNRQGSEESHAGHSGDDDYWSNVPPFAMQLEHERRMYEQHQRIETQIAQLQQEIRQLREELRQRR